MKKNEDKVELSRKLVWIVCSVMVILILTVLFLVSNSDRGMKVSTSGIEITAPINNQKATTIPPVQPTVKERVVYRERPVVTSQPVAKSTTVRTGDTSITVEGQPAIINTGTNNGVMGNNNNVTFNPKPTMSDKQKLDLVIKINEELKRVGKNKTACIDIIVPTNVPNPDAKFLAMDMEKFLKGNGYNIVHNVSTINTPSPYNGIFFDFKEGDACNEITIWMN